jgi:hypothetical protein
MKRSDIARRRLYNQHLARTAFENPADEVTWLGAVQAQDYAGAKWALGQRLKNASDAGIEKAFTDGSILRTHVMRPTWHFVSPADIRWMLALTAPRVNAASAYMYRKLELDKSTFRRSNAVLGKALRGGKQLTREELRNVLERAGVDTAREFRMVYIMMRAELDGIVCSGARRGTQFTYALLEERVPEARPRDRDEALAELTMRYFVSHGPATSHDFSWWSGLTIADATRGLDIAKSKLAHQVLRGRTMWFSPSNLPTTDRSQTAYLLPNYDEYGISYKDRSAMFDAANIKRLAFRHMIVINGWTVGTWRSSLTKGSVVIETNTFAPLTKAQKRAVRVAAERYGAFLGQSVVVAGES